MAWTMLIIAGLFEVLFVLMMKLSEGFTKMKYTAGAVIFGGISFYLLSLALKVIPIGTGYGVWTGIGAVGSVLIGMIFFKESKDTLKLLFVGMIIAGVVGLKLVSG
ncbi:DMT family transporter [Jeotgalibacillus proteolyticus]|uniref:QacE family quaternary ammonium compound efflux SMR transporter n=1 Tax=Jeotgalibacillus proteolyticus TaxID=2082395 RepID=A0A2S5GC19_9BACL|nr:multidrug efflux SMR transporter [Jeotgalibacillus proteolyticus]PPA70560.1 QacE family quaternary ammonium compound efflux SMR transporter [Jeotgalibacillus proteolyticus]